MVMDACIGKLIHREMVIGEKKSLLTDELIYKCASISQILRNEYLRRDPRGFPATIYHRLDLLADQKEIIYTKDSTGKGDIKVNEKILANHSTSKGQQFFSLISFLSEFASHVLDTYAVVLMALDEIIQGNMVVKD